MAKESWSCVALIPKFFSTVQGIAWNSIVPMVLVTACQDGSVCVWQVLSDGESEGEDEKSIVVRVQWSTTLGFCVPGG